MYRHDAILEVMSSKAIGANLQNVMALLERSKMGLVEIPAHRFVELVQWEEEMKAFFVRRAEALGITNVASNLMGLA